MAAVGHTLPDGGAYANSGTVSGTSIGLEGLKKPAQVTNSGTIKGTSSSGIGVRLSAGGTVTNDPSGKITGGADGISSVAGTVTNDGTITGTSGVGVSITDSVATQKGTVTNASGATITGERGVETSGEGTIANTGTISGTAGAAAAIAGGGTITNNAGGKFTGVTMGVEIDGKSGGKANALTNSGAISATDSSNGVAVNMGEGGTIKNNANATITGGYDGVAAGPGDTTLTNAGTITGMNGFGVTINDSGPTDKATVTNTDVITGANGVSITGEGKVTNSKTITATVGTAVAVDGGGSVTNNSGATITGVLLGVVIDGGSGAPSNSLTNDGTIKATNSNNGVAVTMAAGGVIKNNSGATITGGFDGIQVGPGTTTLTNTGAITGTNGFGVTINDSGPTDKATVTNTDTITGANGVSIAGEGKVFNSKTITATVGTGVAVDGGGSVTNSAGATITGVLLGVVIDGGSGTPANSLTNGGTIKATATATSVGVNLGVGGKVDNLAGASISGGYNGLASNSGSVTLVNAGTIAGTAGFGVTINDSGPTDKAIVTNTDIITGVNGVSISGEGALTNSKTITASKGSGVVISGGGSVTNESGATVTAVLKGVEVDGVGSKLINDGSITASSASGFGVVMAEGGNLANEGSGAKISGGEDGVSIESGNATVANSGSITGTNGYGVTINDSGLTDKASVTNSDVITGASAGVSIDGEGTLTNSKTIKATSTSGVGVAIDGVGRVVNQSGGSIAGGAGGVFIDGANAALSNGGTISASATSSYGVMFESGGALVNLTGATIAGGAYGVAIDGAGTVEDKGSISGATAVSITGVGAVVDDGSIKSTKGVTGTAVSLGAAGSTFTLAYGATLTGVIAGFEAGDALYLGDNGLAITNYRTSAGPGNTTVFTLLHDGAAVVTVDLAGNFVGDTFNVKGLGSNPEVAVRSGVAPTTVTVATFESEQATLDALPGGFDIADTAANIEAGLVSLEGDGHIDAIRSTGAVVTVSAASFAADQSALDKIDGGFDISAEPTGVTAAFLNAVETDIAHVDAITVTSGAVDVSVATVEADPLALEKLNSFSISDTAANFSDAIETIEALEKGGATISSIILTGATTPVLDLTQAEATSDTDLLGEISGAYDLDVTGVSSQPYVAYDADFSAAHALLSETFFVPGPTTGKLALAKATSHVQLAVGTYIGASVSGFTGADTIAFESVAYAAGDYVTYAGGAAGGQATIDDSAGVAVADFSVAGDYNASNFTVGENVDGDLVVGWQKKLAHNTVDDFNDDGTSDALWLDTSSDELTDWSIANGAFSATQEIGAIPAGSNFVGTGDFTGNGTSDVLLQDTTTGQVTEWDLSDGAYSAANVLGTEAPSTKWTIAGTGDFNGDGQSDVLWRNATSGDVMIWTVRDDSVVSSSVVAGPGTGYSFLGVGDFNGDGVSDILWENGSTHKLLDWQMKNGVVSASTQLTGPAIPTTSSYLGAGDFLGNGTDDPLFEGSTGALSAWQMTNGQYAGAINLGISVPAGFSEAEVGNYTGGATSDVLIHNPTSGATDIGIISGGKISSFASIGSATASTWRLIA